MKIVQPKPFIFEGGKRALLLLHGFTGSTADCRMLARFLEKRGYTSYSPLYQGHGMPPEELLHTGPDDWWQDVLEGYRLLKRKGHEEIVAIGLSLGGVFSLKLGYTVPVKGIVTMCTPMDMKNKEKMYNGLLQYARTYKKREGKTEELIAKEMASFQERSKELLKPLENLMSEVKDNLDMIYAPTFVVQSRHDEMINIESANVIYENIQSSLKEMKWYEQSGHVITVDKEREQLHEDIFKFLEKLNWESSSD